MRVWGGTIDRRSLSRAKIRTSFSPCLADTKKSAWNETVPPVLPAADDEPAPSKSDEPPEPRSKDKDGSAESPAAGGRDRVDAEKEGVWGDSRCDDCADDEEDDTGNGLPIGSVLVLVEECNNVAGAATGPAGAADGAATEGEGEASTALVISCCSSNKNFREPEGKLEATELHR